MVLDHHGIGCAQESQGDRGIAGNLYAVAVELTGPCFFFSAGNSSMKKGSLKKRRIGRNESLE